MIVVASFIGNIVTDGVQFSFGILLVDLTTHFQSDFATVAMAGGTLTLSFLTFGIIATSLVAVFGCRKMFAIGGLLSAASFFTSTFSPDILGFVILYGFIGGLGFGFIQMSGIIAACHRIMPKWNECWFNACLCSWKLHLVSFKLGFFQVGTKSCGCFQDFASFVSLHLLCYVL